jgi:hypothetical protein
MRSGGCDLFSCEPGRADSTIEAHLELVGVAVGDDAVSAGYTNTITKLDGSGVGVGPVDDGCVSDDEAHES